MEKEEEEGVNYLEEEGAGERQDETEFFLWA